MSDKPSYLELYEEYIRIQELYFSKKKNFDKPPFTVDKQNIKVDFKNTKFNIQKPLYDTFQNALQVHTSNKNKLQEEYNYYKNRLIYGSDSKDMNAFTTITKNINNETKKIQDIIKQISSNENHLVDSVAEKNKTILDHNEAKTKLYRDIITTKDDVQKKIKINDYLKMDAFSKDDLLNMDYMTIPNEFEIHTADIIDVVLKRLNSDLKKKLKKTLKEFSKKSSQLSEVQDKTIKKTKANLKSKINQFVFSNLEECKSKSKGKKYYMSKKDMIAIISKNEALTKKFGKLIDVKKMSKENICDTLFS